MLKSEKCVIIIDSESENDDGDIDELRKLAISSMVKKEIALNIDSLVPITLASHIDHELTESLKIYPNTYDYEIECYSSYLPTRKRPNSEISDEDSKRPKLDEKISYDVENIVRESLPGFFNIDHIINYDKKDSEKNLLKEEELKNKLLKIFNNKKEIALYNKEVATVDKNNFHNDSTFYDSEEEDFDILTDVTLPKEIITDSNVLKYHNLIIEVKNSIENIIKSLDTMSTSIQEKLTKSKKITTQIENLKNQKTELHKEINLNRSKILDLNKVKKQKSLELLKYEQLKKKFSFVQLPQPCLINEVCDSLSTVSVETNDSRNSLFDIDCNQIICPFWLNNVCNDKSCVYQHPKITFKPIVNKNVKIKENDKVFLKEMNPTGFISKLICEACSEIILISSLHMTEDWNCTSCCQQLVMLTKPTDVIKQLILIWHHIYKRYLLAKNVSVENRDPSIIKKLSKCSDAIKAKLSSTVNLSVDVIKQAGGHVILTLNEESRVDDLINFLKSVNYNSSLILLASELSLPIEKLYNLIIDAILYQIEKSIFSNINLLIKKFCLISKYLDYMAVDNLIEWLELCIKMNVINTYNSVISILTKFILQECFGQTFVPCLSLSINDLQLGDKYWNERKNLLNNIVKLYSGNVIKGNFLDLNYNAWMDSSIHALLIKYTIICNFFTGSEEDALELCQQYSSNHFIFRIMFSKLSLNYNSPLVVSNDDKVLLIEHTYNKSEWLLVNRSIKSCVKLLENVPEILYKNLVPIKNSDESLNLYELFLGIGSKFDASIANITPKANVNEQRSIRESSSIWMCYISLLFLRNKPINLDELFKSDSLLSLSNDHLSRVSQFILVKFAKSFSGCQYFLESRRVFLLFEKYIEFVHFLDLYQSINFELLLDFQLPMWLFLIDFSSVRFSQENVDSFLVETSQKLCANVNYCDSCQMFRHIIMCYPIRNVEVWLNFIQILITTNAPHYELIDSCQVATNQFRLSKSLWQYYLNSALKIGNEVLAKKVKEKASKIGFELKS